MSDQIRTSLTFVLNILLAAAGLFIVVSAFKIGAHLSGQNYLAISAFKIIGMVMVGYGSTQAWLILKRGINKNPADQ